MILETGGSEKSVDFEGLYRCYLIEDTIRIARTTAGFGNQKFTSPAEEAFSGICAEFSNLRLVMRGSENQ